MVALRAYQLLLTSGIASVLLAEEEAPPLRLLTVRAEARVAEYALLSPTKRCLLSAFPQGVLSLPRPKRKASPPAVPPSARALKEIPSLMDCPAVVKVMTE